MDDDGDILPRRPTDMEVVDLPRPTVDLVSTMAHPEEQHGVVWTHGSESVG